MDFWLQAVLNAISLAVGVATGSYITFYLTRKQLKSLINEFSESELVQNFKVVLQEARIVLESEESKKFFKKMTEILEKFLSDESEKKEELIRLPQ